MSIERSEMRIVVDGLVLPRAAFVGISLGDENPGSDVERNWGPTEREQNASAIIQAGTGKIFYRMGEQFFSEDTLKLIADDPENIQKEEASNVLRRIEEAHKKKAR